ncbi:hypothetical protein FISHEDRAFT_74117 [Fistulina hepatica ATCC 64428]|uniref:Uncharacterized protein n=1 Tax=Fistulina hepatica ATCC 64428 TaxID=1128425 RepID=A0A0D7AAX4_9AGAR|nr:hypothetical protein FISHEDRAFT_74117 [Fistulina hepatica ATCC 64428]
MSSSPIAPMDEIDAFLQSPPRVEPSPPRTPTPAHANLADTPSLTERLDARTERPASPHTPPPVAGTPPAKKTKTKDATPPPAKERNAKPRHFNKKKATDTYSPRFNKSIFTYNREKRQLEVTMDDGFIHIVNHVLLDAYFTHHEKLCTAEPSQENFKEPAGYTEFARRFNLQHVETKEHWKMLEEFAVLAYHEDIDSWRLHVPAHRVYRGIFAIGLLGFDKTEREHAAEFEGRDVPGRLTTDELIHEEELRRLAEVGQNTMSCITERVAEQGRQKRANAAKKRALTLRSAEAGPSGA